MNKDTQQVENAEKALEGKYSFWWFWFSLWGLAVGYAIVRVLSWIEGTWAEHYLHDLIDWIKEKREAKNAKNDDGCGTK
jgi:hypothetical protein